MERERDSKRESVFVEEKWTAWTLSRDAKKEPGTNEPNRERAHVKGAPGRL